MKTCPECGTQYEDHVSTCLVDGADLTSVPAVAATPTPPSSKGTDDAVPVPPPPSSGGGGGAVVAMVAVVVFLLIAAGVIGVIVVMMSTGPEPKPEPEPARPVPVAKPVPVPLPTPEPSKPAPTITLTSVPTDAEVWEGNTKLCSTPCTTPHPEHAPLPREFVLKKAGFREATYAMDDPGATHQVTMRRLQPAAPKPTPGPRLPAIDTER